MVGQGRPPLPNRSAPASLPVLKVLLFAGMTEKTAVTVGLPDSPFWMAKWTLFLATV